MKQTKELLAMELRIPFKSFQSVEEATTTLKILSEITVPDSTMTIHVVYPERTEINYTSKTYNISTHGRDYYEALLSLYFRMKGFDE